MDTCLAGFKVFLFLEVPFVDTGGIVLTFFVYMLTLFFLGGV